MNKWGTGMITTSSSTFRPHTVRVTGISSVCRMLYSMVQKHDPRIAELCEMPQSFSIKLHIAKLKSPAKKYGNFISLSCLTGKCAAQNF